MSKTSFLKSRHEIIKKMVNYFLTIRIYRLINSKAILLVINIGVKEIFKP
jgi:hypothetical protein